MASLDEIWGNSAPTSNNKLDNIWGSSSQANNQLDNIWGTNQVQQQPDNLEQNGLMNVLGGAWDLVKEPASTALEVLSYLDKPRGAIAGAVNAFQNDTPILDGVQSGWDNNTSWKETFNQDWVKENPKTAAIAGLAADIVADPLWFVTPAKIAKGVSKGSKAIGLTDNVINPAMKAVRNTEAGQKAIAFAEDTSGYNRVADEAFDFNSARATDQLGADDLVDAVRQGKKQYGEDFNKLTDYVEARKLEDAPKLIDNVDTDKVINLYLNGKLAEGIANNEVTRKQAMEVLRDAGEEIPDYLLHNNQRVAKLTQEQKIKTLQKERKDAFTEMREAKRERLLELKEDLKIQQQSGTYAGVNRVKKEIEETKRLLMDLRQYKKATPIDQRYSQLTDLDGTINQETRLFKSNEYLPDALTRDQIMSSIPDPVLRKAIESIGEQFIAKNKANADRLRATGRLSDEQYVSYLDGEHLRRSFAQYETPDEFLEAVRKNGSNEEYRRVYQSLNQAKPSGSGFGATHKVDMKDFVQRQTLSDDTLKKLGLVKDPEYRIMDTLNRSSKTLREDEYLARVATVWGKTGDQAADLSRTLPKRRQYQPIPESSAYGALAGKWVPKDIHDQVIKLTGTGASSSELVNAWQKGVSWFKVAKLANPASTMRNFYSGIPMANVFGKVPMQVMPKYMAKATQAIRGGNKNPLMREVKGTGILGNVWNKQDLKNIIGDNPTGIKKLADKGMNAFGKPDEFWRITTYAYHRDQGKSVREAAEIANKALFDYSNAPEWINTLSRTGAVPFAKFPYFATKETAKALWNKPAQVTKFTKAQNQVNNEDREKIMPDYMKARTLLPLGEGTRMVNGKPQKVQNNLDLSYILPFANDIKLGNPALDALIMSRTGKNGLGQEVIKKGMTPTEKAKVWGEWGYNTFGPSFPLPGNYAGEKLSNAFAGRVDAKGRQYDLVDAVAQTILGLKNAPVNSQEMFNQKVTALTNEQRNIKAIMNQIAKDQSLSKEQKAERIKEHQSQIKEIGKELKETAQAWQREKKRGSN